MKKILNKCKKSIIFYTCIFFVLFILSKIIINLNGLDYMKYIYESSMIIILLGIILGIVQIFLKTKSTRGKKIIIICCACILTIIIIFYKLIFSIIENQAPEYIIEKDNKKYVVYVYSWLDTKVEYYNYINFLLRGTKKKIQDNYNNVSLDVLNKKVRGIYTPNNTYYYDEEGNIINKNHKIK